MGRLFIIDGARALSKAIRRTFGRNTPIQRCQVHKARNIAERLPKEAQAPVRKALRQAWEMEDAARADQRIRNLARRLDKEWPGIAATILEGLDEILCVVRLGLPRELRRSLACTNIIENMRSYVSAATKSGLQDTSGMRSITPSFQEDTGYGRTACRYRFEGQAG